jgi:hypothetical protein
MQTPMLDARVKTKRLTSGAVEFINFPFRPRPTHQPICIVVGDIGMTVLLKLVLRDVGLLFSMDWQVLQFKTYTAAHYFMNDSGTKPHLLLITGPCPAVMEYSISRFKQQGWLNQVPVVACAGWDNTADDQTAAMKSAGADAMIETPYSYTDFMMIAEDILSALAPMFEWSTVVCIDPLTFFDGLDNTQGELSESGRGFTPVIRRAA